MTDITLISGSTLGNAECVAEHLAEQLSEANFATDVQHGPTLEDLTLEGLWLIITSTHGAGEIPDNLQSLHDQISLSDPDLSAVRFGAIGLGNSDYDTFCAAITKLDQLLMSKGAKRIGDILQIDVKEHDIPEDPAELWLKEWINLL